MLTEIHATRQLAAADRQGLDVLFKSTFDADDWGEQYQWGEDNWTLLLKAENEIVCHVGVVDRTITVGGRPWRVGGLGGVATAPAWQRRGCARQLMETAAAFLRDELRVAAGLLICGDERVAYYSRLGWQWVPGPLLIDQPQGKVVLPCNIMVLLFGETAWPAGPIDLCGLPW
jgi:GNAT superfamily N-acetyltransferase